MDEQKRQRYIFIDTETTGLDPVNNDVIEIAAVVFDDGIEVARYSGRMHSTMTVDLEALQVNKRSLYSDVTPIEGQWADALDLRSSIVKGFAEFLVEYMTKDTFVIGHNVFFDYQFIKNMFARDNIDMSRILTTRNLIDTMQLAKYHHDRGDLDLKNFRMVTVWNALFNERLMDSSHSAMQDVFMCKDVYFALREV